LWPDAFAKIGQREGFDVEGEGARNLGLGILKLAILIDRGSAIFTENELIAILKAFEFAFDRPQARLHQALRFSDVTPKPQEYRAGSIPRGDIVVKAALLRASFPNGGDKQDEPEILAVRDLGNGDVISHYLNHPMRPVSIRPSIL